MQNLVYIGMWKINYSNRTALLLIKIRRIFLGEYIDDLQIGNRLSEALNIKVFSKYDAPEQKFGPDGIGSDEISANFGVTFILGSLIFLLLIILVVIAIFISRS